MENKSRLDKAVILDSLMGWSAGFLRKVRAKVESYPELRSRLVKIIKKFPRLADLLRQLTGGREDSGREVETREHAVFKFPVIGWLLRYVRALVFLPRLWDDVARTKKAIRNLEEHTGLEYPDHVYWELEESLRGASKEVEKTFQLYIPYIEGCVQDGESVLDLGCGRGEWLSLLRKKGIPGVGVDSNETMANLARLRGLNIELSDALAYLKNLDDNSQAAVTGFQIMEHLAPAQLVELWTEIFRVLRPGGMLLFETPNPENIQVSSYSFYLDPTHRHPVPPPLAFHTLEALGFRHVHIERSQEVEKTYADNAELDRFFTCGMNYAVIAYKENIYHAPLPKRTRSAQTSSTDLREIVINGPFVGSYSLSMVNRELAAVLESQFPGQVGVCFEEEPSVCPGRDAELDPREPELQPFQQRCKDMESPGVVLYNSYPPNVLRVPGALAVTAAYAWEESEFPKEFVQAFNEQLDGLTVNSTYTKQVLQNNGVNRPIKVIGLGVDHLARRAAKPLPHYLGPGFRFLHVSSCFPRKGLDVLLDAYGKGFTADDDVTLVIKTFPNPHNDAQNMVADFSRQKNAPNVVLIDEDLPPEQVATLYKKCHCLVAPSRGEGFGLPMAEAMWLGLPVITTGFGGQCDFCREDTAWLVDYTFEQARSHLSEDGSLWVEPDADHLARLMRQVSKAPAEERQKKIAAAQDLVRNAFTWQAAGDRLVDFLGQLDREDSERSVRVGLVTTWNSRCGIAEYSKYMLGQLDETLDVVVLAPKEEEKVSLDERFVKRVWEGSKVHEQLPQAVQHAGLEALVVNFHPSFFSSSSLKKMLQVLEGLDIPVFIVFHNTKDSVDMLQGMTKELASAERLLVHGVDDLNRLKDMGLAANAAFFPHGVNTLSGMEQIESENMPEDFLDHRVIASSGFLMAHKGILELIEAFAILKEHDDDLRLLLVNSLYPGQASLEYYDECCKQIRAKGLEKEVHLIPDFLEIEECLWLLQHAELIVYPYLDTPESSSASVRMGLAANRPVACTPLQIFDDVRACVQHLPGHAPSEIAAGIRELLDDPNKLCACDTGREKWLSRFSWAEVGRRISGLVRSVVLS